MVLLVIKEKLILTAFDCCHSYFLQHGMYNTLNIALPVACCTLIVKRNLTYKLSRGGSPNSDSHVDWHGTGAGLRI